MNMREKLAEELASVFKEKKGGKVCPKCGEVHEHSEEDLKEMNGLFKIETQYEKGKGLGVHTEVDASPLTIRTMFMELLKNERLDEEVIASIMFAFIKSRPEVVMAAAQYIVNQKNPDEKTKEISKILHKILEALK